MQFSQACSDRDLEQVRTFFAANLNEPTGLRVGSATPGSPGQLPPIIYTVQREHGPISGAVYAGADVQDATLHRLHGHHRQARVAEQEILMIHELAVAPEKQRHGIGSALLGRAVKDGAAAGAAVAMLVFDGRRPNLAGFYAHAGFTVLSGAEMLVLRFASVGPDPIGFPQSDESYHWAFRILDPARAGALRVAPKPPLTSMPAPAPSAAPAGPARRRWWRRAH